MKPFKHPQISRRRLVASLLLCVVLPLASAARNVYRPAAIDSLASRVTRGTSKDRIFFLTVPSDSDFFCLRADGKKLIIEGNNPVSMAVGLNWYLKYLANIHISWNNPTQALPPRLPLPQKPLHLSTDMKRRYYLNYCTFSYSMPFWDENRWMQEIDWMALHGINMPLSLTGAEVVWRNILLRLGYTADEAKEFIAGPAYMAWWQMNNLEGWGGPLPDEWFDRQERLQKKIVGRMRSLGIEPVLPGYSGMVPRNIGQKLGFDVADPGKWCGFNRPAFLQPDDEHFDSIARIYYDELTRLYGKSRYYSMDPFHEGGSSKGVNLDRAGRKLLTLMKEANTDAKWVMQSWHANPRKEMIANLPKGEIIVLDLYSEKTPKWRREGVYADHDWLYCMLLNFGGNVGMHGRMDSLVGGYYDALSMPQGNEIRGIGATPEGIENNPVMYELLFELPWRRERFDVSEWLRGYQKARYGKEDADVAVAWTALANTVYNAPTDYEGEGTVESLLCARPEWNPQSASTWGCSRLFYDPDSTALAAASMIKAAPRFKGNVNYEYDLADIRRQANADHANSLLRRMAKYREAGDSASIVPLADEFLQLILRQDSLLEGSRGMDVADWLRQAAMAARSDKDRELYLRNAATLITVWGDSVACNEGGLKDYSHREWAGVLSDLYYKRWKAFFDHELHSAPAPDFYRMELDWIDRQVKAYMEQ